MPQSLSLLSFLPKKTKAVSLQYFPLLPLLLSLTARVRRHSTAITGDIFHSHSVYTVTRLSLLSSRPNPGRFVSPVDAFGCLPSMGFAKLSSAILDRGCQCPYQRRCTMSGTLHYITSRHVTSRHVNAHLCTNSQKKPPPPTPKSTKTIYPGPQGIKNQRILW